jgi:PAS domain S-box-containing protein
VFERGAQIGERRWDLPYLSPDADGWAAHRALLDAHQPFREFELSRLGDDETEHFISISGDPLFDAAGAFTGYRGVGTDITQRKRAEIALREREVQLVGILESTADGILAVDRKGRVIRANRRFGEMCRVPKPLLDSGDDQALLNLAASQLNDADTFLMKVHALNATDAEEIDTLTFKDGRIFERHTSPLKLDGAMLGRVWSFRDITERKLAEAALTRESDRNQAFLRNASDGVHILDADGNVLEVSGAFCEMLGYSREELIGANVSLWDAQWSAQELTQLIAKQMAKAGRSVIQTRHRRRDGSFLDVEVTGHGLELDGKPVLFNSARDITERIRAEQRLVETEAQFRGLVEQSIAGTYIIQDGRLSYVNPRFLEIFGYNSAAELIGRDAMSVVAEPDRGMVVEYMRQRIEGEVAIVNYSFTAVRKDGTMIEVGVHGTRATRGGRPAIIGFVQDISAKKRAEEQIQRYVAQIENAFMSTVQVVTTLGEMRDPYTAGHQRRVAEIAVAIGAELGFDARRQEGLRVAGYLHDVGKIRIPSEILSKPGKLSPAEFRLVQGHAQASYDVLKDVEFPWPVAEVALQHHERMDGSGYPQGLKGEAILLEARIITVADVIEAMSSHRPYRAGLGIEAALAEIERGRGITYDPAVADACLKLFRGKGYSIPA